MHEMMKTADPTSPTMGIVSEDDSVSRRSLRSPKYKKGKARANQKAAHPIGRIPSEICMAQALPGNRPNAKATIIMNEGFLKTFITLASQQP
jgi:hypothetical protein